MNFVTKLAQGDANLRRRKSFNEKDLTRKNNTQLQNKRLSNYQDAMLADDINTFQTFDTYGRSVFTQTKFDSGIGNSDRQFHAWECVSIIRSNRSTLDFVIKDNYDLMCFMHVLTHAKNRHIEEPKGCLSLTKILKAKMKISYQCWTQK